MMKRLTQFMLAMLLCLLAVSLNGPVRAEEKSWTVQSALEAVKGWSYGDEKAPLEFLRAEAVAVQGDPEARAELAAAHAALLEGDVADGGINFICDQLYLIGGPSEVPALARLLLDDEHSAVARYALERIPDASVDEALLRALGLAEGAVRIGIINTMGQRGTAAFAEALTPLLTEADAVGKAAATAYASLVNAELAVLEEALLHTGVAQGQALMDGIVRLAYRQIEAGKADGAAYALTQLAGNSDAPESIRIAAIYGLSSIGEEAILPILPELLGSDSEAFFRAGLGVLHSHGGPKAIAVATESYGALKSPRQASLLQAVSAAHGAAALPLIETALHTENEDLKLAALAALGAAGDARHVDLLLQESINGDRNLRRAAQDALAALRGADVNETLVTALETGDPARQERALEALAARQAVEASGAMMIAARSGADSVKREALRALGHVMPQEDLGDLIALLWGDVDDNLRRETEQAITVAVRRTGEVGGAETLARIYESVDSEPIRVSFLNIFGSLGLEAHIDILVEAFEHDSDAVVVAALTALANWPNDHPMDALMAFAESTENSGQRADALEGYVRMLRMARRQSGRHLLAYEKVVALTDEVRVLRSVLSGLSEVRGDAQMALIEKLGHNPDLAREAAVAAEQIRSRSYKLSASHNATEVHLAMDGDGGTRWASGAVQTPGMWFQIDFATHLKVKGVVLDASGARNDYPRAYEVYVFDHEEEMGEPVAVGEPDKPVFQIDFEPVAGRFLRIVQTGKADDYFWSIHEIRIVPAS